MDLPGTQCLRRSLRLVRATAVLPCLRMAPLAAAAKLKLTLGGAPDRGHLPVPDPARDYDDRRGWGLTGLPQLRRVAVLEMPDGLRHRPRARPGRLGEVIRFAA